MFSIKFKINLMRKLNIKERRQAFQNPCNWANDQRSINLGICSFSFYDKIIWFYFHQDSDSHTEESPTKLCQPNWHGAKLKTTVRNYVDTWLPLPQELSTISWLLRWERGEKLSEFIDDPLIHLLTKCVKISLPDGKENPDISLFPKWIQFGKEQ